MNADKLKRNNIIIGKDGGITKVDEIGWGVVNGLDEDEFYPIPLDESLLLKCGFERVEDEVGPPINDMIVCFEIDGFKIMQLHKSDKWVLCDYHRNTQRFQYLHQLMNLCFALHGEELNVEL